jgi:hypothetical protein
MQQDGMYVKYWGEDATLLPANHSTVSLADSQIHSFSIPIIHNIAFGYFASLAPKHMITS